MQSLFFESGKRVVKMKYHIKKIAIAVNFTPETDNALHYAVCLAIKHDATLDIIHAVSPARTGKGTLVNAAYDNLRKYREDILQKHGLEVKIFARMAEVAAFVANYCASNKTDLLIIGVQNHVKKYFGESKSYDIIMKVECPVLSIPLSFTKNNFGHILYPVRDVEGVKEKLFYSKPFIGKESSRLRLLCFGLQKQEQTDDVITIAEKEGIPADVVNFDDSSTKNITSKIISAANDFDDDLIVINATSEKEWYRLFGENYTEYILKEADVAVLSITHMFESAD